MRISFSPILAHIRPIIKAKAAHHAIPAYGPQAIKATQSPRGQLSGLASLPAGDCMERNQPYSPPCSQPPITAQRLPVAGHPTAKHQQHPFVNNKSPVLPDGG